MTAPPHAARGALASCVALGLFALTAPALAGDGVYGRLDGDLNLSLAAGAALMPGAPAFVARGSTIYAESAGLYVGYADAFGSAAVRVDRSLAAGIALKPLFWARFARNAEFGYPRLDLFVDSLTFDIGAFWAAPHGRSIAPEPGLEIALGLGFPIFADATGPFLEVRGALRYGKAELAPDGRYDILDRGAMLSLALAWHHIVNAHIADAGDRSLR
jgi:hypothetical protein